MADIESLFHRFQVAPEHPDFLHFFWFQYNDPSKPLINIMLLSTSLAIVNVQWWPTMV